MFDGPAWGRLIGRMAFVISIRKATAARSYGAVRKHWNWALPGSARSVASVSSKKPTWPSWSPSPKTRSRSSKRRGSTSPFTANAS